MVNQARSGFKVKKVPSIVSIHIRNTMRRFGVVLLLLSVVSMGSVRFSAKAVFQGGGSSTGTLTVTELVMDGIKTADNFTVDVTQGGSSVIGGAQAGSATGNSYTLAPGSYQVVEGSLVGTGYAFAGFLGSCDQSGSVTVSAGQTTSCTAMVETATPQLTLNVVVNGGSKHASDFSIFVDGHTVTSGTVNKLLPGARVVSQTPDSSYDTIIGGDCDSSGNVSLDYGDNKVCTVTDTFNESNTPSASSTLVITQQVNNNYGGIATPGDFMVNVTGTDLSSGSFNGSASGTTITLDPGSYSVNNAQNHGYTGISLDGCSGTIAAGETKACTLLEQDIAPQLTVKVHVDNTNGGSKSAGDFAVHVSASQVSTSDFQGSEAGGKVSFVAGTYNVTGSADSNYTQSLTGDCSGMAAVGDEKSCTINYTYQPSSSGCGSDCSGGSDTGAIKITKVVVGGDSAASDFNIKVSGTNGGEPYKITKPGSADGTWYNGFYPGTYNISESASGETAINGYVASYSASCAGGVVTVAAGQETDCTVTNTWQLQLTDEQSVQVTNTSATITWVTNHLATSRVLYDVVSHSDSDVAAASQPNYGYPNSTIETDDSPMLINHSVTITGLTPGITYYFRPVSHGSPEVVGTEIAITTGTGGYTGGIGGPSAVNWGGNGSGNSGSSPQSFAFVSSPAANTPVGQVEGAFTDVPSGQVLGASTLPKTGVPPLGLLLLGMAAVAAGLVSQRRYLKK